MADSVKRSEPSSGYERKIVSPQRLRTLIEDLRLGPDAKRVVQCHGCFDIVHPGHIRYLQFARSQGDVLVVSITGDAAIDKEPQRPYIPQELRAENLAALELVDYVVIDSHPTAKELLELVRPDVYVKGHEYATSSDARFLAEREVVESHGGRVIFSSGQVVFSSSRLVEAMSPSGDLSAQRLDHVCRRHAIDSGHLATLLDRMRGRTALICGDTVIERYVLCDTSSVASESPMMALKELDQKDYLGGAAVVAMQFAALGAAPILVTALGAGRLADEAAEVLDRAGVRVLAVHRCDPPLKTRFLVDNHKLFKVERATARPLDPVAERRVASLLHAQADSADAAVLFDSGYGMISPGVLRHLGSAFRDRVPMITGAAEPPGNLAAMRGVGMLCSSERKLRTAMSDFDSGLSTVAYRMLDQTQARSMIVTLGKRGLVTFDRPSHDRDSGEWRGRLLSEHLPSFGTRVVDRLGCGEALMTVATLASAVGASLMQSAYLGSVAAALQISKLGTGAVARDDLHQQLTCRAQSEPVAQAALELPGNARRRDEFDPLRL